MPIIKSAKKRVRQARAATTRNLRLKREIRTVQKSLNESINKGKKDVTEELKALQSALDKAVKKNLMHKNKAARVKTQVVKKIKDSKSSIKAEKTKKKKAAPKKTTVSKTSTKKSTAKKPASKQSTPKKTASKSKK